MEALPLSKTEARLSTNKGREFLRMGTGRLRKALIYKTFALIPSEIQFFRRCKHSNNFLFNWISYINQE